MLYLDTSLLVSAAAAESDSARVLDWFGSRAGENVFAISGWVEAEFAAAVAMKVRRGTFSEADAARARAHFAENVVATSRNLEVTSRLFSRAASLAGRTDLTVRAPDALHLAIAEAAPAILCTLDKEQAAAGAAVGIRTLLV